MAQKVRIVRTKVSQDSPENTSNGPQATPGTQDIWGRYAPLKTFIRRYLPLSSASVLAEPAPAAGGHMDWHSELGGQPVPLKSLSGDERQRVERLMSDRLTALRSLAEQYPTDPAAQDLMRAAQSPSPEQVYVMNGQPVVIGWGQGEITSAPAAGPAQTIAPQMGAAQRNAAPTNAAPASPPPAAATAQATGANSAAETSAQAASAATLASTGTGQAGEPPAGGSSRGLLFGCLGSALLFLLLLAAILWWFWDDIRSAFDSQLDEKPPEQQQPITPPEEPAPPVVPPSLEEQTAIPDGDSNGDQERLAQLDQEEQALLARIAQAEEALRDKLDACPMPEGGLEALPDDPAEEFPNGQPEGGLMVAPDEPAEDLPLPENAPILPQPEAKPLPPVQPEQPPVNRAPQGEGQERRPGTEERPENRADSSPPPQPEPQPQQSRCPTPRPSWEAPELAILLDRSGSMRLRAGLDQDYIESLYQRASSGDMAAIAELESLSGKGDNSRLGIAKGAVRDMLETLPKDVDVGVVAFGRCEGAESFKFFSAPDRPRLLSLLQSITPQEGTPLARGLERAGNMVDGVSIPATIVVVTDGEDSCGGDPCAVAQALAAAKPNLTINVVDVNGQGEGACMAQATGGKVYRMRSPDELDRLIQQASGEQPVPPGCE